MADNLFTQEELNSKIAEEKRRLQAKSEERIKEAEERIKAEAERIKAEALQEATERALKAEKRALKIEVASKYKLDEDLHEFLTGATKEELTTQAEKLAKKFSAKIPAKDTSNLDAGNERFRTAKGLRKNGD